VQQKSRAEDLQNQKDAIDGRERRDKLSIDQRQADIQVALKDINDDKAPKPFGGNVFAGILAVIGQGVGCLWCVQLLRPETLLLIWLTLCLIERTSNGNRSR